MQPQLKQDEGSQGTLFQGGYPSNPTHRGYGPERRNAVREAVALGLDPHRRSRMERGYGLPGHHAIIDTLARSTVPVEHIAAPGSPDPAYEGQRLGNPHLEWVSNQAMSGGVLGRYYEGGFASHANGRLGQPSISIARGQEHSPTVIHELGHHVSKFVEQTPHSAYDTPAHQGAEEGFAENYMKQHYRGRRGERQPDVKEPGNWSMSRWPTYAAADKDDWATYDQYREKQGEFNRAFRTVAPATPKPQVERPGGGLPPEHIPGQEPLLDKITSHRGFDYTTMQDVKHTDWDYTIPQKHQGLSRSQFG